jgi:hypothetical protein
LDGANRVQLGDRDWLEIRHFRRMARPMLMLHQPQPRFGERIMINIQSIAASVALTVVAALSMLAALQPAPIASLALAPTGNITFVA